MYDDFYESGECTDDGLSDTSSMDTLKPYKGKLRTCKNKRTKKKHETYRNSSHKIPNFHSSFGRKYFNPYIYQRIGIRKHSRTTRLMTDIAYVKENKRRNNRENKTAEEPRFSIQGLDLKNYEYLSFIGFSRNECYSPDPNNPIKMNLVKASLPRCRDTVMLGKYFEINNKNFINGSLESTCPNHSELINSTRNFEELLVEFGISRGTVFDLVHTVSANNVTPLLVDRTKNKESFQYKNCNERSDNNMDISDDEFDNVVCLEVVERTKPDEMSTLKELKERNSLYTADYSPECISYHEFLKTPKPRDRPRLRINTMYDK